MSQMGEMTGEIWEGYGRDMGGIQDISPMLFPFCTKGFPKIMGEMIDIRGLEVLLRQIFGSCAKFVAISFSCRHNP